MRKIAQRVAPGKSAKETGGGGTGRGEGGSPHVCPGLPVCAPRPREGNTPRRVGPVTSATPERSSKEEPHAVLDSVTCRSSVTFLQVGSVERCSKFGGIISEGVVKVSLDTSQEVCLSRITKIKEGHS